MKMKYLCILLLTFPVVLPKRVSPEKQFISANNLFTASLYKELIKQHTSNLFISPYSAEIALAFTQSGCKGETAQELRTGLHLPDDENEINAGVKTTLSKLQGNELYTLRTANKMYVKEGYPINQQFKNTATDTFEADIENINFVESEKAASTMNEWVEQQTNNKIKNLISPDILDADTRAVLINALYFKGNWSTQFSKHSTRRDNFYTLDSGIEKVDMMHLYEEKFNYYRNYELRADFLELPFEGDDVSMVIVLPERGNLKALEDQLEKVFAPQNFQPEVVNVGLPKFKIESTLPLVDSMKNLGIRKVFNQGEADLSGIAGRKGDLVVSDVLQKTYIEVEEKGVEAAAATYVAIVELSLGVHEPNPKRFIADHPFIFYIKHRDLTLFVGKVVNPNS